MSNLYEIVFADKATQDVEYYKKSGNLSNLIKIDKFLDELREHPGTGKPEQLKHNLSGLWSRRINKKDRLVYNIDEANMKIQILSAEGHYSN